MLRPAPRAPAPRPRAPAGRSRPAAPKPKGGKSQLTNPNHAARAAGARTRAPGHCRGHDTRQARLPRAEAQPALRGRAARTASSGAPAPPGRRLRAPRAAPCGREASRGPPTQGRRHSLWALAGPLGCNGKAAPAVARRPTARLPQKGACLYATWALPAERASQASRTRSFALHRHHMTI